MDTDKLKKQNNRKVYVNRQHTEVMIRINTKPSYAYGGHITFKSPFQPGNKCKIITPDQTKLTVTLYFWYKITSAAGTLLCKVNFVEL